MTDLDTIRTALQQVEDPELHRSIMDLGMVQELQLQDGVVRPS